MQQIKITVGSIELVASLLDTPTAKAVIDCLPIESIAQTWGEEVYFEVPLRAKRENNAKDVVEPGEIAFWVEGNCVAIGFGRTPLSKGHEIRLAAKTNIWAITHDDVKKLGTVKPGDIIRIDSME
ncbi:cyclophilin-like fold protein [Kaarinaea lacus]